MAIFICGYCGRKNRVGQTHCIDGCGAELPIVYGEINGRLVTDEKEHENLKGDEFYCVFLFL